MPRHSRKVKGKRQTYFTTPPTCPASGAWTNTATFTYEDGSSDQPRRHDTLHEVLRGRGAALSDRCRL